MIKHQVGANLRRRSSPAKRRRSPALLASLISLGLALPAGAAALAPADMRIYGAAFAAAESGNWAQARALAETADDPLPGLVIVARDLTRRESPATFGELNGFLEDHPDFHLAAAVRQAAERRIGAALAPADIVDWFGDRTPRTAPGLIALAGALGALGRGQEAEDLVRARWPDIELTSDQFQRLRAGPGAALVEADHIGRLDALLWQNRGQEAGWMLDLVPTGYRQLADARLKLRNRQGGVDAAIAAVGAELADDDGLLHERVRWRRRADLTGGAIELLARQPAGTTHLDRWWTERRILMRRPFNDGDPVSAYAVSSSHGQTDGLGLAEAEFFSGWLALRHLHRPGDALRHFDRMYQSVESPISRAKGAYWIGRALAALGDADQARQWFETAAVFPFTFYGQLAAGELGVPSISGLGPAPDIDTDALDRMAGSEPVRLATSLLALDQRREAYATLFHLGRTREEPADRAALALASLDLGMPDLAVRVSKWAVRGGALFAETLYPVIPLPGLDPTSDQALILGLTRQESEFNARAISPAGARGLMQLMPATADLVAGKLGVDHRRALLTTDPAHNVRLGSTYLDGRITLFNGSYVMSVAAYNAGDRRATEWARRYGDPRMADVHGVIDWIESIPFSETRNYVMRVMEATIVYRYRLGEDVGVGTLEEDLTR